METHALLQACKAAHRFVHLHAPPSAKRDEMLRTLDIVIFKQEHS